MKSVFSSRRNKVPHNNEGKENKEAPFFSKESKKPFFNGSNGVAIQTKLSIGQPGDKYEKEADSVADAVVNKTATPNIQNKEISSIQREALATPQEDEKLGTAEQRMEEDKLVQEKPEIQRMENPEEEMVNKMEGEEEKEMISKMDEEQEEDPNAVQAKSDGTPQTASSKITQQLKNKSGRGKHLSKTTQTEMESSFGTDFSDVNIHTDQDAVHMNKELGAKAFTHGKDIYFNSGKYNPDTTEGKRLLAHELTHTIQQKGGDTIQRSCTPVELTALHTEMHSYCDQPRRCNMQTDTCATATAKVAAGNGCVSLRTLIQQKCFHPGDPGYHTHMQQIAQASAALRNCHGVQSVKCNEEDRRPRDPHPVPVPKSTFEKIKDFARRVVESGLDAEQAAEEFLQQNPGIAWTIIGLGVVGIIVLLADDLTLAGIADDVLIPVIATLIRVSWRYAI